MGTASACVVRKARLRRHRIQGSCAGWSASLGSPLPTWQACRMSSCRPTSPCYGTGAPVTRARGRSSLTQARIPSVGRAEKWEVRIQPCKPVCKPHAPRRTETGEPLGDRDSLGSSVRRGQGQSPETTRDTGDARRMAHNPAILRFYAQAEPDGSSDACMAKSFASAGC